jgi:dipeptidyl aminopeptidase/acylaminoacyl peptidase
MRPWPWPLVFALVCGLPSAASAQAPPGRALKPDDIFSLKELADPQVSPEGKWVAYTVTSLDRKKDEADTDIHMSPWAGGAALRLTSGAKGETKPRFSPDGRFLAFLSEREGTKTQVWLMDRAGGEAVKLTDYKASVSDLAWSPDSTRLALVVSDVDPDDPGTDEAEGKEKEKKPRPIVIRRLQFKRDEEGYLRDVRSHIHVFEVSPRTSVQVTSGPYDDSAPAFSPDGRQVAFVSNRTADPDSNHDRDVFVVAARAGETPRRLPSGPGTDGAPAWSPDGKSIAFVAGGDPGDMWYGPSHLALLPVDGGPPRPLTQLLDRNVGSPRFSPDGRFVYVLVEDGGNSHLARVSVAGGALERVAGGERDISAFDVGAAGQVAVLESEPTHPEEVYALAPPGLRRLTTANDEFLKGIALARVERFKARSPDGTPIDGFLTRPPGAPAGARLPTVLRIHGGPALQYSTAFRFEWQVLAAGGYAVVAANPRGSTGHGRAFSRAIWGDWGNLDHQDVLAALDHVIAQGVADPDRLGVGGWSYGGILTDYVITQTTRFKAATSGSSMANHLAGYGTDQYQYEWELEVGLPWVVPAAYLKLSPFFRVDKVKTPTLILCGADDMNVPLLASEQLYQALRRLGVPTELVIYPGQRHDIVRPSFVKDRYERYIAWYDRYLKTGGAAP